MTAKNANPNRLVITLLAGAMAGGAALVAIAQPVETPVPKTVRIREIEKLVKEGQLNMIDAIKMAEAHAKAIAFNAQCSVKPGPFAQPAPESKPDPNQLRLEYRITCVKENQPVTVIIDGKEKKVVSPPEPRTPPPGPKPDPKPQA